MMDSWVGNFRWTNPPARYKVKFMRKLCTAFPIVCSLFLGQSVLAGHQVDLRGIINVPGQQAAVLQIDEENWVGRTSDHFKGEMRGSSYQIEIQEVDLANEIVKTRIDGEDYTNRLPVPSRPAAAKSWIHLQNIDFQQAMDIYGVLSGRTILLHPAVARTPFSCEASWTDKVPAKTDIVVCFANSLGLRQTASLEDGDCFLQIMPISMAQTVTLGAKDLHTVETEKIEHGGIYFRDVTVEQAINVCGKLLGRERKNNETSVSGLIYFVTTKPLSKAQAVYALETLIRWNGAEIILNDDNTFSVTKIPSPPK
jgi:hypothetical protein